MNVQEKIKHLMSCGLKGDFTEIEKMYLGEPFDPNDEMYKELLRYSKILCEKYSSLCSEQNESKRCNEILNILFPGHGVLYGVGAGINVVIGMVELGNNCYINANVFLMPDVIVTTGDYFLCAPNVILGSGSSSGSTSKIEIGNDVWLCADVTVDGNVIIEDGSVVGLGSHVISGTTVKERTIFSGNPAAFLKDIVRKQESTHDYCLLNDDEDYNYVVSHLKKLGFDGDFTEVIKMIRGKNYNSLDPMVSKINDYTHAMCKRRNRASLEERKMLDDALFPIKGNNSIIGENVFIDSIGSVSLGSNVTIGNKVCLMGKIRIGNNCIIGNNVTLVAIGHGTYFEDRHVTPTGEMLNTGGFVIVLDGVSIGNNVKVGQKVVIDSDIKNNTAKTFSREFQIENI